MVGYFILLFLLQLLGYTQTNRQTLSILVSSVHILLSLPISINSFPSQISVCQLFNCIFVPQRKLLVVFLAPRSSCNPTPTKIRKVEERRLTTIYKQIEICKTITFQFNTNTPTISPSSPLPFTIIEYLYHTPTVSIPTKRHHGYRNGAPLCWQPGRMAQPAPN